MSNFFATQVDDGSGTLIWALKPTGYVALIALFIVLLMIISLLRQRNKRKFDAKQLVFCAVAIALATVTSMIAIFKMPMGGSVTLLSMLFITSIGYWYGFSIGLTTAVAYGVLQLLLGPYILSIPQLFLDYIFAFGALGLSGLFSNKKHGLILGYLAGVLGRYVFAILSGVIFFASYAPETMSPFIYSAVYNGAYLGAEALITVIILALPAVSQAFRIVKKMALSQATS